MFRGVEVQYGDTFNEKLNLRLNYTFTELKSGTIMRVPKHSANVQLGYAFNSISSLSTVYNYRGDREAIDGSILDSYSLLDLNYTRSFGKSMSLFLWINNLMDTVYEEILDYSTLGRNFRIGLQLKF